MRENDFIREMNLSQIRKHRPDLGIRPSVAQIKKALTAPMRNG
jgi:hypothetical protein